MSNKVGCILNVVKTGSALVYELKCKQCGSHFNRRSDSFYNKKRNNQICTKCSNINKLKTAKQISNCNRSRPYEALYNKLVRNCKRRNIEIDLTYKEFYEICLNEKHCHYCLKIIKRHKYNNTNTTALDRKNNSLGYSKENVVSCCWKCNNAKGKDFSYQEWYNMTSYLRNFWKYNRHKYDI